MDPLWEQSSVSSDVLPIQYEWLVWMGVHLVPHSERSTHHLEKKRAEGCAPHYIKGNKTVSISHFFGHVGKYIFKWISSLRKMLSIWLFFMRFNKSEFLSTICYRYRRMFRATFPVREPCNLQQLPRSLPLWVCGGLPLFRRGNLRR